MHVHSLRKFAKTRYELTMSEKIANVLIGHEGYLSIYDRFTFEHLRDAYKKAEDNLLVFEQVDIGDINEQLQKKEGQITKQSEEIQDLKQQLDDINRRLDKGVSLYLAQELEKLRKKK